MFDITEADEAALTPTQALLNLRLIAEQYYRHEETYSVLHMYGQAAYKIGCDYVAIETAMNSAKSRVDAGLA